MSNGLTIDSCDEIYTDIEEAKSEIWRRWNDVDLRKKVMEYIGDLPPFFKNPPIVLLSRNIATPDNEFHRALNLSKKLELNLFIEEYHSDKFCTINIDKLSRARLRFLIKKNHNRNYIINVVKVIDIHKNDGKPFDSIFTCWGEKLIDFHHRLFAPWNNEVKYYDNSAWTKSKGQNISEHYHYFLSLFICHGVLLEDFYAQTSEQHRFFAINTVMPAFNELEMKFGYKPLIVKLIPKGEEGDMFWESYPNLSEDVSVQNK